MRPTSSYRMLPLLSCLVLGACGGAATSQGAPDAAMPVDAAMSACAPPEPSLCTPANEGSVIRGVARFDPAHYKPGQDVSLVLYLHHRVVLKAGEAMLGGHPHAFKRYPSVDVSSGQIPFSIDLCELGTAMWSEENCGFNLLAILDEDGSNDLRKGAPALLPQAGELMKMVPLEISCHAASPCLELQLDCVGGEACTTFQPTPMSECRCAASHCPSDDSMCTP